MDTLFSGAMLVSRRVVTLDQIELKIFPKDRGENSKKSLSRPPPWRYVEAHVSPKMCLSKVVSAHLWNTGYLAKGIAWGVL